MDRITKSLLDEFVVANSLEALREDEAFEQFSGWLVVSEHYSGSFGPDDVATGAGGDCGIDAIAVIVNGSLVTDPDEVQDLAETNGYVDATFVFVQSERSSSFNLGKISKFGSGVRDFLSESPALVQNERVKLAAKIVKAVIDQSAVFKPGNPQCFLYYATTGQWVEDRNLVAARDSERGLVEQLNLFRSVKFDCLGAAELQGLSRKSKNSVTAQVVFGERALLPDLPKVEQAYLGIMAATEFLKLVANANNEIIAGIFYDNVRHWQEWNKVNSEMRTTLEDPDAQLYFPLLNNGVTVVARKVNSTRNVFTIEDYQIVNGCQTSFVLFETRDALGPDVFVPVRLIATEDEDVRDAIIKATNRQTQVPEDLFLAMSEFPKRLEAYFPTYDGRKRLYYERRPRQYAADASVEKVRIIDMKALVRAFASVYLDLPHRTTRNYKALVRSIGTDIFADDHVLEPYYAAAFAYYRLEYLFRSQAIAADLKPARYHILMAARLLHDAGRLPLMNSNAMSRWSVNFCDVLWDDDKSKKLFEQAAHIVRKVAADNLNRDNIRTEPFTDGVLREFGLKP